MSLKIYKFENTWSGLYYTLFATYMYREALNLTGYLLSPEIPDKP